MSLTTCATLLYLAFVFNMLYLMIMAVRIITQAIYIDVDETELIQTNMVKNAYLIMGGITLGAMLAGMLGLWKSSRKGLGTLFVSMSTLIVLEIVFAIYIEVHWKGQKTKIINESLDLLYQSYGTSQQSRVTIDGLQQKLKCCGFLNWTDWINGSYPKSCCLGNTYCSIPFAEGCKFKLKEIIEMLSSNIWNQHLTFFRFQVLCVLLSLYPLLIVVRGKSCRIDATGNARDGGNRSELLGTMLDTLVIHRGSVTYDDDSISL